MHVTKLIRIGTSLGLVVPRKVLEEMNWWQGDHVKQTVVNGELQVRNITQKPVKAKRERADFGDAKHKGA